MRLTTLLRVRLFGPLTETVARRRQRRRRARSGPVRHLRRAVVAIFLLVLVAVGAILALYIAPGHFGVVGGQVASVIQSTLGPGYFVTVGNTRLDLDRVSGMVVEVDDIEIRDSGGVVVATLPETRLAIDAYDLLRLQTTIRTVEIVDAEISFARNTGGSVYLGNADTIRDTPAAVSPVAATTAASEALPLPGTEVDGGFPDLVQALRILDRGIEPPITAAIEAGFERFSLIKSTITIWDANTQSRRDFRHADMAVKVDGAAGKVSVDLGVSGYSGRWTVVAERSLDDGAGGRNLSLVFSQITLADIFPAIADENVPIKSDIPLYGRATIALSEFGDIEDANIRLDLGAGILEVGRNEGSIQLDEATVKLRWDVDNRVLLIEPSTAFLGQSRSVWVGSVRPVGEGGAKKYAFELETQGAVLAPRDSDAPALAVQRIAVSGDYDADERLLTIDSGTLVSPIGSVAIAGSLGFDGPTPSLAMAANLSPMPVWVLKQIWPPTIAAPARRWFLKNVRDGQLTAGRYEAAIPSGILWNESHPPIAEDAVRLQLRVEDLDFAPFGDLPLVEGASANVVLAGRTFGLDFDGGTLTTPSGERVALEAAAFAIPRTGPVGTPAQLVAQLTGSAQGLAEIANAEPLRSLERRDLEAHGFTGTGSASVSVGWPMKPDLTDPEIDWQVSVSLKDFSSEQPLDGRRIRNANLTANFDPQEMSVSGKAEIDGVVADVGIIQPVDGKTTGSTTGSEIRLSLDEKARERLGMDTGNLLGGVVSAKVVSLPGKGQGQHYELDLTKARLTLPALGWSKGIGVPAQASFDLIPVEGGYEARGIELAGEGFGLSGSARLDGSYGVQSAELTRVALRKGDSLRASIKRSGSGYSIAATGESFDVRGVIARFSSTGGVTGGGQAGNIAIDAKIGRLVGFNRQTISNANLVLNFGGGTLRRLDLNGALGPSAISSVFRDENSGATVNVSIGDAGRFFRFIDLYTRMAGGQITVQGRREGASGPMVGALDIANFAVVNEPAMSRVASDPAANQPATGFDPTNVAFDRLYASFTKRESVFVIGDAVLRGNEIGATFGGSLDMGNGQISLTGTYIPSYSFNNAFSRIPILGLALGGGLDEGLVGVTFKVQGPVGAPQLFINPLSAIAPGIFRKIFEFQ